MIVVSGGVKLQAGRREQAAEVVRRVVEPTRDEHGCISYTFFTGIEDPDYLHVFEEWESEAALDAHLRTPHVVAFFAALPEVVAEAPVVKRYVVSEVKPL